MRKCLPRLHHISKQKNCQQEDPRECLRIGNYHVSKHRFKRIGAENPYPQRQDACNSGEKHIAPSFQTAPDCHADPIDQVKAGDCMEELLPDGSCISGDPESRDQPFSEQQDEGCLLYTSFISAMLFSS